MNYNNETLLEIIDDNGTSCLDYEPSDFYWFIVNGILLNVIGFFGILGNIISMIILSRPQMRSSINYLLIGLARIDTVLIITSILIFGLVGIYPYTGCLFNYFFVVMPHIAPYLFPIATVAQTASVYLTVTVSFDRYIAVCKPLRARSLCTYGRARIYVICIVIFSILYNLPKLWESQIRSDFHEEANMTVYCIRPSEFRNNNVYKSVYINWCYLIFIYLIPFLALAYLNICIYIQVRIANRERARLSRNQKREIGLATMLLCVVIVFFVCNLLPLVINIIEVFHLDIDEVLFGRMIKTSNFLVTVNSSVNFIIYVTFGEKFKRLFLVLYCSNRICGRFNESADGANHDDSFISNGDRQSLRLHRHNNASIRNGSTTIRHNGMSFNGSRRCRSEKDGIGGSGSNRKSPAPCVYYPAKVSTVGYSTQISIPMNEWDGNSTSTTTTTIF
ncbi:FMRFamide receptor [Onthophagus taurus]|uniref:FMRFamide receptor n=1 Tax=Onthophagus taurus TaxID=166361 RepID=UPI0039BDDDAD